MKTLAVLVALLGGIAAMPTVGSSNGIDFHDKMLQTTNISCWDEVALDIDTIAGIETHFDQFCHSTKFPIRLAKNDALRETYDLGLAGEVSHFNAVNSWCDVPVEITSESCWSTIKDITVTCQKAQGLPVGLMGSGAMALPCGYMSFDASRKPASRQAAVDSSHALDKRNASITPCQGCPPCTSPISSCRPPNWMSCSDAERACLLDNACEYTSCLMTGFCLGCS
ncbi:hypothetical protein AC578_3470 [Pseudocercospora eumusae]|uniref:Uncharacterized protein n=1 Tax=Pseudocercospora eumusae TaxID=321146 RepID=A0A139HR63_9PEZI|nr:hypothetical protein AC578_3470 [Pseudocercospora eumusae]